MKRFAADDLLLSGPLQKPPPLPTVEARSKAKGERSAGSTGHLASTLLCLFPFLPITTTHARPIHSSTMQSLITLLVATLFAVAHASPSQFWNPASTAYEASITAMSPKCRDALNKVYADKELDRCLSEHGAP